MQREYDMDIVYAAEKPSIANLLSKHIEQPIAAAEIDVSENPDETGSFRIDWQFRHFVMAPNGEIADDELELLD